MSKTLQFAAACIVLGCVCIIAVNRCPLPPFLQRGQLWGTRPPINEDWISYRTEKNIPAADVQSLHAANLFSSLLITEKSSNTHITVRTRGLPDDAAGVSVSDGVLRIVEKDVWNTERLPASYGWFHDWYIDAEIIIEVPKSTVFTAMQFDVQRSVKADSVTAKTVTVHGSGSPAFKARDCSFGTLTSDGEIRIELSDTVMSSGCALTSKDGSIILKSVTAPAVSISSSDGRFQAERIKAESVQCRMANGSCKLEGTVKKRIDIISEDGSVSVDLNGTALAETLSIRANDGSITVENLTAPAAQIQTDDGAIHITDVHCDSVQCHSRDGSIRLNGRVAKNAELITHDGSITADFKESVLTEMLHVSSRDGSVSVENVSAPKADIATEDGQLKIQQCVLHNLTAQAYNSMSVDADLSGTCRLTSKTGNIKLYLQKAENEYAISSLNSSTGSTVRAIGNITIENTGNTAETVPVIAGNPDAPNKLILSAADGKISIKTKQ